MISFEEGARDDRGTEDFEEIKCAEIEAQWITFAFTAVSTPSASLVLHITSSSHLSPSFITIPSPAHDPSLSTPLPLDTVAASLLSEWAESDVNSASAQLIEERSSDDFPASMSIVDFSLPLPRRCLSRFLSRSLSCSLSSSSPVDSTSSS